MYLYFTGALQKHPGNFILCSKNNEKSHNQNTKSMLLLLPFLLLMYLVDSILRSFYNISAIWQILMFGQMSCYLYNLKMICLLCPKREDHNARIFHKLTLVLKQNETGCFFSSPLRLSCL